MAKFTVRGEIIPFSATQRNIRVQNVEDLRRFWQEERIETDLDWARPEVLVTLGTQKWVNSCAIGEIVDYTIEPWDRADGRRIRGVAFEVVTAANL